MKVFCIGFNKTGTTSLSSIFSNNSFLVAPQSPFEYNTYSYIYGNSSTIIEMIKNDYFEYSFFQDVPFSFPNFYKDLHNNFPSAKFILTVRDNEKVWYDSLIRFHKKFTNFKNPKKIQYIYEGWIHKIQTNVYGAPNYDPYNYEILTKSYKTHITDVEKFFSDKPGKLLKVNLKDKELISKLENFLEVPFLDRTIPQLNKT